MSANTTASHLGWLNTEDGPEGAALIAARRADEVAHPHPVTEIPQSFPGYDDFEGDGYGILRGGRMVPATQDDLTALSAAIVATTPASYVGYDD